MHSNDEDSHLSILTAGASVRPVRFEAQAQRLFFNPWQVLSVAKIIADAIDAVFEDTSVSELFGGDNLV